jgi:hypothetical protein
VVHNGLVVTYMFEGLRQSVLGGCMVTYQRKVWKALVMYVHIQSCKTPMKFQSEFSASGFGIHVDGSVRHGNI